MPISCPIGLGWLEVESTKQQVKKVAAYRMLIRLY